MDDRDEDAEAWLLFQAQYPPAPLPRELHGNPYAVSRRPGFLYWTLGAALAAWLLTWRAPVPQRPQAAAPQREESPPPFYGKEPGLAAAPYFSEEIASLPAPPAPGIWRAVNPEKTLRYLPRGVPAEPVALELKNTAASGLGNPPYLEPGRSGFIESREGTIARRNNGKETYVVRVGAVRGAVGS